MSPIMKVLSNHMSSRCESEIFEFAVGCGERSAGPFLNSLVQVAFDSSSSNVGTRHRLQNGVASGRTAAAGGIADLRARQRPRNHDCRCETPVIRTGNLDRAQRCRSATSSQDVIDSYEWR